MSEAAHSNPGGSKALDPVVVVGVDGSEPSKRALQWAAFVAATTGVTIRAVAAWHVSPVVTTAGAWPADFNPEADTRKLLHDTVTAVLGDSPSVTVEEVVAQGNAAQILLEASNNTHLLVVGSRGHGGFAGLLLGSVSTTCTEHATCPVLVIHGDTPPPATARS